MLPDDTVICPAHEYTLANLAFAKIVMPDNDAVKNQIIQVETLRAQGKPSLPTTLQLEKMINPFLRAKTLEAFIALRKAKDVF